MRSRPHDEAMVDLYRSDLALALVVIDGILADGNWAELLAVLRQLADTAISAQPPLKSPSG